MIKAEHWSDRAACGGTNPDLFSYPESSHAQLLATAEKYCFNCPVAQECLDDAYREHNGWVSDDLEFTMRGGYMPLNATPNKPGRPFRKPDSDGLTRCRNGHIVDPDVKDSRGHVRCLGCKNNDKGLDGAGNRIKCRLGLHPWVEDNLYDYKGKKRCKACRENGRLRRSQGENSTVCPRSKHRKTPETWDETNKKCLKCEAYNEVRRMRHVPKSARMAA